MPVKRSTFRSERLPSGAAVIEASRRQGRSKFNVRRNVKKETGYDSEKEAKWAADLKLLHSQGAISNLNEQVPYTLLPADKAAGYYKPMKFTADFTYLDTEGVPHVVDVKGFKTKEYRIRKRLMWQLLGIKVEEV